MTITFLNDLQIKKLKSFYFFIFKSLKNKVYLLLDFEVIWLSCGTYVCFTFLVLSNQAPFRGTLLDLWSFYEKWNQLKYHNSVKLPQNKKVKVFNFFSNFLNLREYSAFTLLFEGNFTSFDG